MRKEFILMTTMITGLNNSVPLKHYIQEVK